MCVCVPLCVFLRDNRLLWSLLHWRRLQVNIFSVESNWVMVTTSSIYPAYRIHWIQRFFLLLIWRCLPIHNTAYCISLQCIASLNTLWIEKICSTASNSGTSSKQSLFICLQHTWNIWKTSDEIHSCCENVLSIMAASFTMAWHGRMEKAIVIIQMTVYLPLAWLVRRSCIILKRMKF